MSEGDHLSAQKAKELELSKSRVKHDQYKILTVPRARRVHQSFLTTPPTALNSLCKSIYYVTLMPLLDTPFADVLILNGPGTCLTLCMAVYLNKVKPNYC